MPISKVAEENEVLRLDSLYFQRRDIDQLKQIYAQAHDRLGDICYVTDGIHASIDFDEGSGIKLISAKHPKEGYFDLTSVEEISAASHAVNPRTALNPDDVLISTVGTIGNAAVVRDEMLPANSDRHVGIIRPRNDVERPLSSDYLTAFLISRYGRIQSSRETTGNVQPNLFLIKIRDFKVARFSDRFEALVEALSLRTLAAFRSSTDKQKQAEDTLLAALGLADWKPPEPLSYTATLTDIIGVKRLDAQFHRPKFKELQAVHENRFELQYLHDVVLKGRTVPYSETGTVPIIRSGDLTDIDIDDAAMLHADASEPIFLLKKGDVLISSIGFGSIGKVQVFDKEGRYSTVSEVTVVRQGKLNPFYIMAYLRSEAGQLQIDRYITGATGQLHLYPRDVEKFFIPILPADKQIEFERIYNSARQLKTLSRQLLEATKRAVEIAIEDGEAAAMTFLDQAEGAS